MAECLSEGQGETAVKGPGHPGGAFREVGGGKDFTPGSAAGAHSVCTGGRPGKAGSTSESDSARWAVPVRAHECVFVHTCPRACMASLCCSDCLSPTQTDGKSMEISHQTKCLQSAPRAARETDLGLTLDLPASSPTVPASTLYRQSPSLRRSPLESTGPKPHCAQTMTGRAEKERSRGRGGISEPPGKTVLEERRVTEEKKGKWAATSGQRAGGCAGVGLQPGPAPCQALSGLCARGGVTPCCSVGQRGLNLHSITLSPAEAGSCCLACTQWPSSGGLTGLPSAEVLSQSDEPTATPSLASRSVAT